MRRRGRDCEGNIPSEMLDTIDQIKNLINRVGFYKNWKEGLGARYKRMMIDLAKVAGKAVNNDWEGSEDELEVQHEESSATSG